MMVKREDPVDISNQRGELGKGGGGRRGERREVGGGGASSSLGWVRSYLPHQRLASSLAPPDPTPTRDI